MHKCHYIVLYFHEIKKYIATGRILILERETRKHLKTVFYYTHIQKADN